MRQLIIGLSLGFVCGASAMALAQWADSPQGGFRTYSMEQRLYRDVAPAPQLVPIAPLPLVPGPAASYRTPC